MSDFRGKKVVIYFYPKDDTPVCTIESCAFRDFNGQFKDLNTEVIGISPDDLQSHEQFISKYSLPFLLLSGVWKGRMVDGVEKMGMERSTFLIDEEGKLTKEWRGVKVDGHV